MDKLGDLLPQLPARQNGLNGTSTPSRRLSPQSQPSHPRCSAVEFGKAMAALTALKRTSDMTEPQIRAWYATLGLFPAKTINAAILELCLTETRFPELGDVYQICRRKLPPELQADYVPNGSADPNRPSGKEIAAIAQRLGLEV